MIIDRINTWKRKPEAIRFKAWIKQPSTIKGLLIFASMAGIGIDPERLAAYLTGAGIIYGAISTFYDKN